MGLLQELIMVLELLASKLFYGHLNYVNIGKKVYVIQMFFKMILWYGSEYIVL